MAKKHGFLTRSLSVLIVALLLISSNPSFAPTASARAIAEGPRLQMDKAAHSRMTQHAYQMAGLPGEVRQEIEDNTSRPVTPPDPLACSLILMDLPEDGGRPAIEIGAEDEDAFFVGELACSPLIFWHHAWNPNDNSTWGRGLGGDSALEWANYYLDWAIYEYKQGEKRKAYYLLGRAAHLLGDAATPAHAHGDPHLPPLNNEEDRYEVWLGDGSGAAMPAGGPLDYEALRDLARLALEPDHCPPGVDPSLCWTLSDHLQTNSANFASGDTATLWRDGPIIKIDGKKPEYGWKGKGRVNADLFHIFYWVAEKADDYDSNDADGELDSGQRDLTDPAKLAGIRDAVWPRGVQGIAALIQLFFDLADDKPVVSSSTISPGPAGDPSTQFTFGITYTDSEDQLPEYVRLVVNGVSYPMNPVDPSDLHTNDGKDYSRVQSFSQTGEYTYYFAISDGLHKEVRSGNLTFSVRPANPGQITVTANPSSLPLDGVSTSTITVLVRDSAGNPLANRTVEFSADKAFAFTPGRATTNAQGIATSVFQPFELGDTTITALCEGKTGTTVVHVTSQAGAYDIRLSATLRESSQTYAKYALSTWTTYRSNGQTYYGTMTLTTNRGTFANGQQTMTVDVCDGVFSTGNCQGYDPLLTVTQSGPVTVIGTIEASSGSVSFDAVVGAARDYSAGKSVAGTGSSNDGWENDHEVAWSPDGRYLASLSDRHAYVWNILNWRMVADLTLGGTQLNSLEFSPRGSYLGVCGTDFFGVYRLSDFSQYWQVEDYSNLHHAHSLAWSDDETKLAVIGGYTSVRVYNVASKALERTLSVPAEGTTGSERLLCVDWQGSRLTAAGYGGVGYVWDTNSWSRSAYDVHLDRIWSCRWLADASWAAYVDRWQDPYMSIVFVNPGNGSMVSRDFGSRILSVDWSPSVTEKKVAVAFADDQGSIRDMSGNEYARLLSAGQYSIAWSPNNLIAGVGGNVSIFAPYDVGKPFVRIDSPGDNTATVAASVSVTGVISDISGIVSAQLVVNGGAPSQITLADDGHFEAGAQLADGSNDIVVQATDTAGNVGSMTVVVRKVVDDQGPMISMAGSLPAQGVVGTIFRITVRVVDSSSGVDPSTVFAHVQRPDENTIASMRLYDDGVAGGDEAAGDSMFTGMWNSAGRVEAYYLVDFAAADRKGNQGELENGLGILAFDLPTISGITHVPSEPMSNESTVISAIVTDSSGIALVTLHYSISGGTNWTPLSMAYDAASERYQCAIGPQSVPSVLYKIRAVDSLSNVSESPTYSYSVRPPASNSKIFAIWAAPCRVVSCT